MIPIRTHKKEHFLVKSTGVMPVKDPRAWKSVSRMVGRTNRKGAVTGLRRISRRDRVPQSRMTNKILVSTGSGDLISKLLDLEQASLDLEAVSLFPDGVYERGEGAHRLGTSVNSFSP